MNLNNNLQFNFKKFLNNFELVVSGGIFLITFILIIYIIFTQFNAHKSNLNFKSIPEGDLFKKVKRFQDERVIFGENIIELNNKILELQKTDRPIIDMGGKKRFNPFLPY